METQTKEKMYRILEEVFPVHFLRYFNSPEEVHFIESLKTSTELFVFSGVLRDFLLQYNNDSPRDFDFVVKDLNADIKSVIKKYLIRQTQFGGYKCRINNKDIDIWSLNETWAIKKYRPFYLQNYLPLTAFFNITAAVYSLSENKLFIHDRFKDFLENKKHRKLDIVLKDNPYPALCIIKAFEMMQKYSLSLSDELENYIVMYNKVLSEEKYEEVQLKHYSQIKYSYQSIQDRILDLQKSPRSMDRLRFYDSSMLLFDKQELKRTPALL